MRPGGEQLRLPLWRRRRFKDDVHLRRLPFPRRRLSRISFPPAPGTARAGRRRGKDAVAPVNLAAFERGSRCGFSRGVHAHQPLDGHDLYRCCSCVAQDSGGRDCGLAPRSQRPRNLRSVRAYPRRTRATMDNSFPREQGRPLSFCFRWAVHQACRSAATSIPHQLANATGQELATGDQHGSLGSS